MRFSLSGAPAITADILGGEELTYTIFYLRHANGASAELEIKGYWSFLGDDVGAALGKVLSC
jgi:hypothetical protein